MGMTIVYYNEYEMLGYSLIYFYEHVHPPLQLHSLSTLISLFVFSLDTYIKVVMKGHIGYFKS